MKIIDINYAVFILSNNRAKTIRTQETLLKNGYSGKWFVVVDNLDKQKELYIKKFGESKVFVFDKEKEAESVDSMTNNGKLNSVVFARNAVYDLAESKGYKYFIVLDDDITRILVRYPDVYGNRLLSKEITNFDFLFNFLVNFAAKTKAYSISVGMEGDFIGGVGGNWMKHKRRSFQFYVLDTENRMEFKGLANEDINASLLTGVKGGLVFTFSQAQLMTEGTLKEGGMTDFYGEDEMKYIQHFYTIMVAPSCNKIRMKLDGATLITSWRKAVPLIVSSKWKKTG